MAHKELKLRDYVLVLRGHWWVVVTGAVLGTAIGIALAYFLPKRFKSETTVLVDQMDAEQKYVRDGATSDDLNQRLASLKEQITSRTRLAEVIQKLNLYPGDINREPMSELVDRLKGAVDVEALEPMAGTDERSLPGFMVTVTFGNAQLAQKICAALTSNFMEQNLSQQTTQSRQTTQFLTQQLADAKARLDAESAKLADVQHRNAGSLPDQEQANLSLLMGLNTQLQAASESSSRAQEDKAFSESLLTQQLAAWKSSQTISDPGTMEIRLKNMQDQLATLRAQYTDEYPDVIKLKKDIAQLQQKIAAAQQTPPSAETAPGPAPSDPPQIQQLRAQVRRDDLAVGAAQKQQAAVQAQIRVLESRVQSSPLVAQDFKEVTQNYQTALDSYNDLLKKRQDSAMVTDLEQHQGSDQFHVLDPPSLPLKPEFPKRSLFALGGFGGGIFLSLALLMFKMQGDTSLHNEQDVELMLQLPVLALVSDFAPNTGKERKHPGRSGSGESLSLKA
jgi:polysaccharide chain length determinant protein (PEP-CTERM system associated)